MVVLENILEKRAYNKSVHCVESAAFSEEGKDAINWPIWLLGREKKIDIIKKCALDFHKKIWHFLSS